jgi:hypothetical protein
MANTFYPPGPNLGTNCCSPVTIPSSFEVTDLTSGTIVINYANIISPPDLTMFDSLNRQIYPAGVLDLTPGQTSGQVQIDMANVVFSGVCRLKIT